MTLGKKPPSFHIFVTVGAIACLIPNTIITTPTAIKAKIVKTLIIDSQNSNSQII